MYYSSIKNSNKIDEEMRTVVKTRELAQHFSKIPGGMPINQQVFRKFA
jgi:hypothetical protein